MKYTKEIEKLAGSNVSKSCLLSMVKKVHFKLWRSIFIFKLRLCENYKRYQRQIFTVWKAHDLSHRKQNLWSYTQNVYEGLNIDKNTVRTSSVYTYWVDKSCHISDKWGASIIEIFTPWDLEIHATKSSTLIINVGTKIMDIFQLDWVVMDA